MKFKFLKSKFFQKGFIGPIGDDLPSLVPIVFALLLFFTIFTATMDTFAKKNKTFEENLSSIALARQLRGDSLILDYDQFKSRCDLANLTNYSFNYSVAIYNPFSQDSQIGFNPDDFMTEFVENNVNSDLFLQIPLVNGKKFVCEYKKPGSSQLSINNKNYYYRFYPVAVSLKKDFDGGEYSIIVPTYLVVLIWK
ncbi:MAG: hypothetical protein PHQ98_02565 [Candidatus ainarchaeum sp.]|nr:hypothetical protein [Candidatus ainarchaeum sp.]